ncbi:thymidine phosphorylase [Rhodobacter capsulatus]|uniref:Thymidine phosphorylase n=1 Tax=Rhodobacter capsulatus TaxID=1061 RepID=A0A0Q0UIR8_RHOCA|nr:thymidine phosphorylase [Rhodobacter capsulatus]KQB13349.1 thymidine phosphorylase [Rhodobacter capsulatus]KQB13607.1 thymidine phosphorylase [Rhodobacter capsulatus]PZX24344.1 thymidine phosphorylase [Rhodobacter capsulatus]QNR63681.1 thymidine phosphorylase [Rhodobacter capsulatus]WER09832.1 thymidine phosphorylase [Rhodobacter capsulatus]
MDARSIIMAVRDGAGLSPEAAAWFARGLADGTVSDAQAGAFAMAVLCRGIGPGGRVALTRAMRDSGQVVRWDLPGPVVDKHSTGGIGDSVSLLLAPALAACGVYVPMISGRGLGHTGGTLDKMEAIPGYKSLPGVEMLRKVVAEVGCAIIGATEEIAPADKRLYGIRDISGTVESIDLITASILSKKLAVGLDALVLDVKVGSGAFMATVEDARALAESLVKTANDAGVRTSALMTDMNQSLGQSAGNALEVLEVMETLTGSAVNEALWDVTAALGGEVLMLAGRAESLDDGAALIDAAIESGRAAEIFGRMVAALGGPVDFVERYPDRLPAAPLIVPVPAPRAGFVARVNGRALGEAVVRLGGGRLVGTDRINPSVGLTGQAMIGAEMTRGEALALVHAPDQARADRAVAAVLAAYQLSDDPPEEPPLIHCRIGPEEL